MVRGKTESDQRVSIVAKNINFAHENHSQTLGLKYEDKMEMKQYNIGNIPVKAALAVINNAGVNIAANNTLLLEASVFTGKVQYDIGSKSNVYLKADVGTINFGAINGQGTVGVGVRGAVGAEIGSFYIEGFKEENTNNYSLGASLGFKFK